MTITEPTHGRNGATTRAPPAPEADRVAAIVARAGMPVDTVARIRRRLHTAWRPPSVDAYIADPWPFERADLPDPEIRL